MRESGEQALAEHREIFRFSASIWGSKPIMHILVGVNRVNIKNYQVFWCETPGKFHGWTDPQSRWPWSFNMKVLSPWCCWIWMLWSSLDEKTGEATVVDPKGLKIKDSCGHRMEIRMLSIGIYWHHFCYIILTSSDARRVLAISCWLGGSDWDEVKWDRRVSETFRLETLPSTRMRN